MRKDVTILWPDDLLPICPHCEEELTEIYAKQHGFFTQFHVIYFCPHCRKLLGTAANL